MPPPVGAREARHRTVETAVRFRRRGHTGESRRMAVPLGHPPAEQSPEADGADRDWKKRMGIDGGAAPFSRLELMNDNNNKMKARKETIRRAVENGSLVKVNRLLSAAHLLHCEANNLIEEASDTLQENGLLVGSLKKYHNDVLYRYDRYFKDFAEMIVGEECKTAFWRDMEAFGKMFREWAKIDGEDGARDEEA